MGLTESAIGRCFAPPLADHADLCGLDVQALALVAEAEQQPFQRRYAAGLLLALVGDPRIVPDTPDMLLVPGGNFVQGSDRRMIETALDRWRGCGVQRKWLQKEYPAHLVQIRPFRIAKYLVTNLEYARFITATGYPILPSSWIFGIYPAISSNHPVWSVPPEAADRYVVWLAAQTGRSFRLPTEAEWEYAAGGCEGRAFPWGDTFDPTCANTVEDGPLQTTPVGIYASGVSPCGAADMAGNVEEIVADLYRPYKGGSVVSDDLGSDGTYRITRGGSFTKYGDLARCQRRHGWHAGPIYAIGFRLAEDV